MCQVNENFFIGKLVDTDTLQNITKYCSNCYKELELDERVYLYQETYNYLCSNCACELSEELHQELQEEEEEGGALF